MVRIDRNDGTLSEVDAQVLQSEGGRWPFDLHVMVGDFGSRADLVRTVQACVVAPGVVCVGVDPAHHRTESHFGTTTGVRPSDYDIVAAAGNASFKSGDWRAGVEAVADRAAQSSLSARASTVVQIPDSVVNVQVADSSSHWVLWTIVAIVAGCGLLVAWSVRRRQRETEEAMHRIGELRDDAVTRDEEEREWHDKAKTSFDEASVRRRRGPAVQSPAPVVVNNQASGGNSGGSGDLALGYMLGRDAAPVVEREVVVERDTSSSWDSGSSSDGGGSGSSFDTSFDSTFSSGGGGSDFGGGFDSGGGGSSGGGSDF